MKIKLPFGIRNKKIIHISEIKEEERGLKCNCICPNCKQKLIAKIGNYRVKHFAHVNEECIAGLESALHLYAKEVIQHEKKLKLPKIDIKYTENCITLRDFDFVDNPLYNFEDDAYEYADLEVITETIGKDTFINFNKIIEEERCDDFIPDIIAYANNTPLLIEIAVTHFIDNDKYSKILKKNISCIEIDFDIKDLNKHNFNKEYIADLIINSTENKKWIYNVKEIERKKAIIEKNKIFKEKKDKINKTKLENENKFFSSFQPKTYTNNKKMLPLQEYNKQQKQKYKDELNTNLWWQHFIKEQQIDVYDIPSCINVIIDEEYVFECDNKVWQSAIFSTFIINPQIDSFRIFDVTVWLKRSFIKINRNTAYSKSFFTKNLYKILIEYFSRLTKLGYIKRDSHFGGYDTSYKVLHKNLTLPLPPKEKVIHKNEIIIYNVQATPPAEVFIHRHSTPNNVTNYSKFGTCTGCGKNTADWITFDGRTKTCVCRTCHYKDDPRYTK